MYYTVIKHDGHLRTRGECFLHTRDKHFSSVPKCPECLSQCNTRIRLLHLVYDIDLRAQNNKTRFFYVLFNNYSMSARWIRDDR